MWKHRLLSLVWRVFSPLGRFLFVVSLVVSLKKALIVGPNRINENALCQIKKELQSQPHNHIQ